tara:strand:- start:316 stop:1509 length:1194 start_codon:yes stop_codon:yes gene_type:complete
MKTETEKKDWQKGYDLDYLIDIQDNVFEIYNKKVLNPFLVMKKNRVADALWKDELFRTTNHTGGFQITKLKVGGSISMFTGYKVPILQKKKGDVIVKKLSPSYSEKENKEIETALNYRTENFNSYVYVLDECEQSHEMVKKLNFKLVGRQYNTFADVIAIYYKGEKRDFPKMETAELWTLCRLSDDVNMMRYIAPIQDILLKLEKEGVINFTNHYSNYNRKNTWSAISLRGYDKDWRFIEKPSEMNKKWKEENKDKKFFLQDTELMKHFDLKNFSKHSGNLIYDLLEFVGIDTAPHRIRFMKLKGGEGTLGRHTDQVCPDTGVKDGKLMRLHFPIFTNEKVKFRCWPSAHFDEVIMRTGECWYLDTRKPHEATNGGTDDRIHLVIDVPASKKIRSLI